MKHLFPQYTCTIYKYFTIVCLITNIYMYKCIMWSHIKQIASRAMYTYMHVYIFDIYVYTLKYIFTAA